MPNNTFHIGWGNPSIYYMDLDAVTPVWKKMPNCVEDSVQLTPTRGDKLEARIEGGAPEAVKYQQSAYELAYAVRVAKERAAMPIEHVDGNVAHEYAIVVVPEDPTVPGFYIERSAVSVEDPFNANDGSNWTYHHDVLTPSSGKLVKWGVFTATEGTSTAAGTYTIAVAQGYDFASGGSVPASA